MDSTLTMKLPDVKSTCVTHVKGENYE